MCFFLTAAVALNLDPQSTDVINAASYNVENGTTLVLDAGDRLGLANVVGNTVCLSGFNASTWYVLPGTLGVATDLGP